MPTFKLDGQEIPFEPGDTIMRAAWRQGIEIPHYCWHPGLSVAANCRMCLVEIKAERPMMLPTLAWDENKKEFVPASKPKLQPACQQVAVEGQEVFAKSKEATQAQGNVQEFLLLNHPVDCPICDQAGECKLQDYWETSQGKLKRKMTEPVHKPKAVTFGPTIVYDAERCIMCTRCIRFLEEVTGTCELGMVERGNHTELTLAAGKQVDNPYATNIVDICPVGALTSREFRFRARVWYLDSAQSVCTGCATGCNIDVDSREGRIYRVKPRANSSVNGFWMCDEGRRTWHRNQGEHRLASSYVRGGDEFVDTDPSDVIAAAAAALQGAPKAAVLVSASASLEEGFLAREIATRLGGTVSIVASPRTSSIADDGKLISTDRFPNRAGLLALGLREEQTPPQGAGAALLVRADVVAANEAAWGAFLEGVAETLVVDDNVGKTMAYADHVLAIGSHFEAPGSFVNRDGHLQVFPATVAAPGRAMAGWEALAGLLAVLGGPRYDSVGEVFAALCASLGLGSGRSHAAVTSSGTPLESWKGGSASSRSASTESATL